MSALDDLRRSLAQPAPVYVCVGDESMLVREAIEAVRGAVLSGGLVAFNHATFTCGEEGAAGFAEACRQVPVMALRRLVEVRQVQDGNKAVMEALLAYVQAPIDSTVLLVSGLKMPAAIGGIDYGIRVTNQVKKTGLTLKFDGEGVDPATFARARAKPWGVTVETAAVQRLLDLGGEDLDTLAGNIELCAGFVGTGGSITAAVVAEVCASTAEADVWKLTDSIVAGDADGALAELHTRLPAGTRVGAVGYCWGGAIADLAACRTKVDAAVCYYGRANVNWLTESPGCPVLYHFGAEDPLIPPATVAQIQAGRPASQVWVYPGAGHGFSCDERSEFHPASAALAEERTLSFFARHLLLQDS